jgi:hypothetical protein
MHDVVREARLQRRSRELHQLAALEVRRSDVLACQRDAETVNGGEHCIGRVGERMRSGQVRAPYIGCAKPIRPALQSDIRDQG